jgi:hypothetical protein
MSEVEKLRGDVDRILGDIGRLHEDHDHIDGLVTGGRDPGAGLILRQDRNERQIETTQEQLSTLVDTVQAQTDAAQANQNIADDRCEARASRTHKRIDKEREARGAEIQTKATDPISKLKSEAAAAKLWIRVAVWVVGPIYLGLIGLLFYLVRDALGATTGF